MFSLCEVSFPILLVTRHWVDASETYLLLFADDVVVLRSSAGDHTRVKGLGPQSQDISVAHCREEGLLAEGQSTSPDNRSTFRPPAVGLSRYTLVS